MACENCVVFGLFFGLLPHQRPGLERLGRFSNKMQHVQFFPSPYTKPLGSFVDGISAFLVHAGLDH